LIREFTDKRWLITPGCTTCPHTRKCVHVSYTLYIK